MSFYRKKPIIVDAWKTSELLWAAGHDWKRLPTCVQEAYEKGVFLFLDNAIILTTLESQKFRSEKEDVIIKGIKGEFYSCKSDIFKATYEDIDNDD